MIAVFRQGWELLSCVNEACGSERIREAGHAHHLPCSVCGSEMEVCPLRIEPVTDGAVGIPEVAAAFDFDAMKTALAAAREEAYRFCEISEHYRGRVCAYDDAIAMLDAARETGL